MTSNQSIPPGTVEANAPVYKPEKEIFSWTSKSRPFKKRTREYWVTLVAIASLLSFIMFLAEGTMPVILIISVLFLYYVLSTVEPHDVTFKITDRGVRVEEKLTQWSLLTKFWFTKRMDSTTLNFVMTAFPWNLELMVQERDVSKLKSILAKHLPEEEPENTTFNKASNWVSKKILKN